MEGQAERILVRTAVRGVQAHRDRRWTRWIEGRKRSSTSSGGPWLAGQGHPIFAIWADPHWIGAAGAGALRRGAGIGQPRSSADNAPTGGAMWCSGHPGWQWLSVLHARGTDHSLVCGGRSFSEAHLLEDAWNTWNGDGVDVARDDGSCAGCLVPPLFDFEFFGRCQWSGLAIDA